MHDVIIVGGGVAAFSAALFVSRRGHKTLVIGKDIGGQANYTDVIENYPGLPESGGYQLVSVIRQQAESFGAEYLSAEASKIKAADGGFVVTAYHKQYKSQALILAFGKTPRDLAVPGEEEFKGRGISYCATCDAPLFKRKIVTVAGIGDISLEAALLAAKYANKVYLLAKSDKLIGHPALLKAVRSNRKIELMPFVQILAAAGQQTLERLRLKDLKSGQEFELPTDGLFVELGYVVQSHFLTDLVELNQEGAIVVQSDQSTSVPGIYACGDVTDRPFKQAVISAGEAAAAGLAVSDYLLKQQGGSGANHDWTELKKVKS